MKRFKTAFPCIVQSDSAFISSSVNKLPLSDVSRRYMASTREPYRVTSANIMLFHAIFSKLPYFSSPSELVCHFRLCIQTVLGDRG